MVFPLSKNIFIYRPLSPLMVFPVSKLILFYQQLVYLDGISSTQTYINLPTTVSLGGISSTQTYINLPTTCLPRWYSLYPNLYSFTNHLSTSMVFPLSKLIFIYQPLISLGGISSFQTYIHLPTTCLPRWYFLYPNLYYFTNHLSTSMVFPLSKLILIYRPLSPLMVVPLPKHIFIYRPLPPSMVFPVSKLILFYQPLVYLDGISSI